MQTNDAQSADTRQSPPPGRGCTAREILNAFTGGAAVLADLESEWLAERERLTADNARLREALAALVAVQNGPPLYTYTKAWEEAMAEAERLIGEGQGGNP